MGECWHPVVIRNADGGDLWVGAISSEALVVQSPQKIASLRRVRIRVTDIVRLDSSWGTTAGQVS